VRHTKRGLRLEPANRRYRPIEPEDGDDVRVAGRVLMAVKIISG